jgi:hypothetical protein
MLLQQKRDNKLYIKAMLKKGALLSICNIPALPYDVAQSV